MQGPMAGKKSKGRKPKPKPRAGRKRLRRYSPEFKENAVKLARRGDRPIKAVAAELGLPPATLYTWVYDYEHEHGSIAPEGETPGQELARLRKENERLRMEREILKKAATFFAKESE